MLCTGHVVDPAVIDVVFNDPVFVNPVGGIGGLVDELAKHLWAAVLGALHGKV